MKYAKVLALAAVVAGALMAFIGAGTASATVLCSTTADPCPNGQAWTNGTPLVFSVPAGGSVRLTDTNGNTLDTCTKADVEGKISNTGSATETVTGVIENLPWTECTFPTTTISTNNKLKVHKIAGTSDGLVTSDSQIEVTIQNFFGSCVYGVKTTEEIGSLTEGKGTGAVFHATAVATRFGSNFACPATANWTGTYVLTSPSNTTLSVSESGT
jgi:hypothetical protein